MTLSAGLMLAQTQVPVQKSEEIRIVNSKEYYIHVVQKSQTLYSISRAYDVSMDELKFENPDARKGLSIGQELKIPVKSRDAIVRESYRSGNYEFFYHIVKKGEDFNRIASIYSVELDNLKSINRNLSEPLKTGQYLKIPIESKTEVVEKPVVEKPSAATAAPQKADNSPIIYTAKEGDNLYRLALKFHVSIDDIKKLNPGLNEYFYIGRKIKIPQKKNKENYIKHRVLKRQRLSNIAKLYGLSYSSVLQMNPRRRNRANAGELIKIPAPYQPQKEPNQPQKEPIPEIIEPKEVVITTLINRDSLRCFSAEFNLDKRHKVALMIPLFLEEVDSVRFDPENPDFENLKATSLRFLNFYYGSLMAIDSLGKQGLKIDLHVYDVDADISKAIKVINEFELRDMDLIIGPFYASVFPTVAAFAKNYRIPIVNPLSNRSEVVNYNPNVFKFQPTKRYQIDDVQQLVANYYKQSKIFLVNHRRDLMSDPLDNFSKALQEVIEEEIKLPNMDIYNLAVEKAAADTGLLSNMAYNETITDSALMLPVVHPFINIEGRTLFTEELQTNIVDTTILPNEIVSIHYDVDSLNPFKKQAAVFRDNLVIVNSDDNVFALNVLTELNILRDTFPTTLIGIPNWEVFENMDNEIYKNLNLHFLSSSYVDYHNADIISFVKKYRTEYLTEPDNYAFTGFDISWYFINALMKFGNNFQDCLQYYHPKLIRPEIIFKKDNRSNGYENIHWQFMKFHNYQLRKVPLKVNHK